MSESQLVDVCRRDSVLIITISDVARRNAYSAPMQQQLIAALEAAMSADDPCRAIVLTGKGEHFCAGGALDALGGKMTMLEARRGIVASQAVTRLIATGVKPVVAAVAGVAYGAGMGLALVCDFVVATPSARFSAAFVRFNLLPDLALWWSLSQRVGAGRAKELIALGTEISGRDAHGMGIVSRLAEADTLLDEAIAFAATLAQRPAEAIALLKAGFASGVGNTLEEALRFEREVQPFLLDTADHREAVQAFVERRQPDFSAR